MKKHLEFVKGLSDKAPFIHAEAEELRRKCLIVIMNLQSEVHTKTEALEAARSHCIP
jgi:hypothetical protein